MHTCMLFFLFITHLTCKHDATLLLNTCVLPETFPYIPQLKVSYEIDMNIIPLSIDFIHTSPIQFPDNFLFIGKKF